MAAQILTLEELAPRLSRFDRLMGLDIGMKTIGLALSDVERRLASPLVTIRRTRFSEDAATLLKRAAEFEVAALVIGLPLNMDGSEGPRAQSTRAFVRNLPDSVSVSYWDERLSTAAVTRAAHRAGRLAKEARRSRGPDGGRLHPAGGAGSARENRHREMKRGSAREPLRALTSRFRNRGSRSHRPDIRSHRPDIRSRNSRDSHNNTATKPPPPHRGRQGR